MKSLCTFVEVAALFLCAMGVHAQSRTQVLASTDQPANIKSVRALSVSDGADLEIISDHPLVPSLTKLDAPDRLIIDLPNSLVLNTQKPIAFHNHDINRVRLSQFQPTVARIVLDLAQPVRYTWDAAGNRLTVRLRPSQQATSMPTAPAFQAGVQPVAVPVNPVSSGAVMLAGSRLAAGSSVTAGSDTAVLHLGRGGEVRVCPGTTVSVTPSQNGRSLMLGMSTGALEAHYSLDASSDSILTPDFRILLAGPGEFHYSVSADARGNTCVQALPGNTASVIVSELLGDATYQVKPSQEVLFHSGQVKSVDLTVMRSCGCPAPPPATLLAAKPAFSAAPSTETRGFLDETNTAGVKSETSSSTHVSETTALPASKPDDVHVQVDVPMVFRASDLPLAQPSAQPAPTHEAALLPVRESRKPAFFQISALPPAPARNPHHGFFGKVKGFLAAIFS